MKAATVHLALATLAAVGLILFIVWTGIVDPL